MNSWRAFGILLMLVMMAGQGGAVETKSFYDFTMKGIDGKERSLKEYQGRVLLIVNTASRCGFTPQYKELEALHKRYQQQGLTVLGFPANNFMGQEPGSDSEIQQFCEINYGVTFPLFSKISVKGKDIHPLYEYLTSTPGVEGGISWNFNKFLVDQKGRPVARYGSRVAPMDKELTTQIEKLLKNKE